jgi:uncharacterized protein YajQ (UPF0234 family)
MFSLKFKAYFSFYFKDRNLKSAQQQKINTRGSRMSEGEIVQQLRELNDKVERIAKAINELPRIMDDKLKVLNQNQGEIIRLLRETKGKSIAHSMEK